MTVTIDFRDWKYMSQIERFQEETDDLMVIAGLKEGSIEVDFNKMTQRDEKKETKFETGGRMFFEVHAFGSGFVSFTTSAFVDKDGYVEPMLS